MHIYIHIYIYIERERERERERETNTHREREVCERPFCPILVFQKGILSLLNTFEAIGSPGKVSSKTQPRYVTREYCIIFIFLYFIYSFLALLTLTLLAKQYGFIFSKVHP